MKKNTWFKHPNDLSNDKRVSTLIDREGGKGYGTYMYIIELLHMQPDGKLSFQQLNTMKRKGFAKSYMEKIVREFQLFIIKDSEFKSIIYYSFSTDECAVVASNSSDTQRVFDEYTSSTEETPEQIEIPKTVDNQQNTNNIYRKLTLARVRRDKRREEKNRAEQKKEESDAADFGSKGSSWRALIDSLAPDSEWKEVVCMKSGFSQLLMKYFKEALEIFKGHVILHGKEKSICTCEDARSYFANYTRIGQHTSINLNKALIAISASQQTVNPYRYEQRVNGLRTYLGCPIPEDAPPRPNVTAFWDEATQSWVSQ